MGGGGGSSDQTTTAEPWGPQGQELLKLFRGADQYLLNGAVPVYPGSRVAPQNTDQLAAQDALRANVGILDQQAQQVAGSNQQLLSASDVGNNPIVADAVQAALNPLAKQFTTQVLPSLKIGGIDAGQSSSSRQGVLEANATRDFNETSSNLVGKLMGDFYTSGLDAQAKGVALSPQVQGLTNAGAANLAAVGDTNQQYQQALLSDEVQRYLTEQNSYLTKLNNFRNLITGGFGGVSTGPSGVQQPGQLGQLIGGGLSGYAATGNPWGAAIGAAATLV